MGTTTEPDSAITLEMGRTLRQLRERVGLSVTALAARCEISQPYLSQIERGLSSPSMSTIYRLAAALGVRPGDLLPPITAEAATVVRAGEGDLVAISDRPDTAHGRALLFRGDIPLEVVEYIIEPHQYVGDWFDAKGVRGVYVVSGEVTIEVAGQGAYTLGPRDFISFGNGASDRWTVAGPASTHLLFVASNLSK